jgi:hypothetical protein
MPADNTKKNKQSKRTVFEDGTVKEVCRDQVISQISEASGSQPQDVAAMLTDLEKRQDDLIARIKVSPSTPKNQR